MDGDILAFVAVMTIIVLAFGTFAGERSRRHKITKLELEARIAEAKATEQSSDKEVQAHLEDRVRVLESIVTDGGYRLSSEIDGLRSLEHEKDAGEV
jgi:Flp pilus assembly protein TadB